MDFLNKINEYASEQKPDAVELQSDTHDVPQENTDVCENNGESSENNEEAPSLKEMVQSGEIQMSWTRVNTSNWCGCNNACFHSCYNIG